MNVLCPHEMTLLYFSTFKEAHFVRVLSLRSSVIHGFVTALTLPSCPVLCECAASSVLEPRALLSACPVLCWSVVFGSQHSCLEFRFRVGVRTLALHVLSHCVSVRLEFARPRALLFTCVVCVCVCGVARSPCFHRLRAFMLCLVLCGTQLVFFIGCVLLCCHVLCEHAAYECSH